MILTTLIKPILINELYSLNFLDDKYNYLNLFNLINIKNWLKKDVYTLYMSEFRISEF